MRRKVVGIAGIAALAAVTGLGLEAQPRSSSGQWRSVGGDPAFTRYSPLDQINKNNVKTLKIAWRRPGLPADLAAQDKSPRTTGYFKSTPLMVGGRLYAQDAAGLIEAFAPDTGATLWIQERFAGDTIKGSGMRGIAYVEVGGKGRLLAVRDHWLYAVDLDGRIVRSFGQFFGSMALTPQIALTAVVLMVVLGALTGAIPAWNAMRVNVVTAFRRI